MDLFHPTLFIDKSTDNKWIERKFIRNNTLFEVKDKRHMIGDDVEHRELHLIVNNDVNKLKWLEDRKYYAPQVLKNHLTAAGFKDIQFALNYSFQDLKDSINESKLYENYIVKARKD